MSLSLRTSPKATTFIRQSNNSRLWYRFFHGRPTAELLFLNQKPRLREKRRRGGEQVCFPCGSFLPLFGLLHSSPYYSLRRVSSQIPFVLPHSSSLHLQEKLLANSISLPGNVLDLNRRGFSSVTDGGTDSETDNESDNAADVFKSTADLKEVERVCKVIDGLFGLDRNMEAVLDECGINLTHDLVMDVLERFRHARKPAFRFFCWAGQKPGFDHDSRTYNKMMNVLAKNRQFETMLAMLEEMGAKGLVTMDTFVIAIKAFAAAKERKKAVGIFELMKKYNYKVGVDTINCLLESLGRVKLAKEAQALFEKLRDRFTPNLRSHTILLGGWCRVRNLMEAGRVWNEMIDKGFKPDIVAHNVMIEGLLRSRRTFDVVKLFEVMKSRGPLPNVRSYTIMIREFCKQGKMNEAVQYFYEMLDSGCQPDAAVYTCLITGFGNLKRMDMVYRLLKEMQEKGCPPDGRTYNALIKLLTSQGMRDDAIRVYKKMIQSGIQPTIHTFNMIMKSFFQSRNYDMGCAIWDEMREKGICPDDISYTVFIRGLISLGRSGEACKLLEEMIEKGMKAPLLDYNKFAADFSRAGKPDILEELAQKMKFSGKFDVSNILTKWAEIMKKRVKRKGSFKTDGRCI
ncbi:pentatricopeptide repeat-containing protein At3g62470, mitochondrial-like [Durio zibethinus]|uniref:Pentatricopeptide repeat-containing protein At3g62470, mitochondrial-like n=1 Tax=Durio zibethinus TaxID=66656 RepID=A0A6P5XSI6_DURZI|nr:pentatricopeptide repeat-containing protein At3g62470, mitochondrial-like [Durio zibethinus]